MRRILATLLAVSLLALTPGAAQAASTSKKDPDDTQGRLDLKRVSLKSQGKKIVGTITTWEAFADGDLQYGAALGIDFRLTKKKMRGVAVRANGSRLRADICTYTTGGPIAGTACSKVAVKRVNATTMRVTVPRKKIEKGAKSYRWRGGSFAPNGAAGCGTSPFCMDTMVDDPDKWFRFKA